MGSKFRLWQPCKCIMSVLGVLSLAPCYSEKNTSAGTSRWSVWISSQLMNSFVGSGFMSGPLPPALGLKRKRTEGRKREKFYIYLDVTHTHAFLVHTHTLSHTEAFTHRRLHRDFYTQTFLHTDAFTHRPFYTQTLLHTDAFTHRSFYT